MIIHFYPRPPRGGRLHQRAAQLAHEGISIHALREEGDGRKGGRPRKAKDFYPRPPRGGRQGLIYDMMDTTAFLSTPSARRATDQTVWPLPSRHISIHALREEGDPAGASYSLTITIFLSTPSARRATTGLYGLMSAAEEFLSTPSARRATKIELK